MLFHKRTTSKNRSHKNNKKRLALSIFSVILISLSMVLGIVFGSISIVKNAEKGSDFSNSLNVKFNINPDGFKENPTQAEAEKNVKDTAFNYSEYLRSQNYQNSNVWYEFYDKSPATGDKFKATIQANLPLGKVETKRAYDKDEDKWIKENPYQVLFKALNSSNKTFVYRWYNEQKDKTKTKYSVINFDDFINWDSAQTKVVSNTDGKYGVVFHVQTSEKLNKIYADMFNAYNANKETGDKKLEIYQQPRLYLVNNLNGFFNEANYHLNTWVLSEKEQGERYIKYVEYYKGTDYQRFSSDYGKDQAGLIDHLSLAPATNEEDLVGKSFINGSLFDYVDNDTFGTIKYSWMSNYVEKIMTVSNFDDKGESSFFPKEITKTITNDVSDAKNPKLSNFWYVPTVSSSQNEQTASNIYLNNIKTFGFKAPVLAMDFTTGFTSNQAIETAIKLKYAVSEYAPNFIDTIFGGKNIIFVISMGFLAFLLILGVLLMALYRMTGLFAWLSLMFGLSMSFLVASLASASISMGLIIGLFVLSLLGTSLALLLCQRMKKKLDNGLDVKTAVLKVFQSSLMTCVDMVVASIVFGTCLLYVSSITLSPIGLVLIVGSTMMFVSLYFVNFLLHFGLFYNHYLANARSFCCFKNATPVTLREYEQFNFEYSSRANKVHLNLFTWRTYVALGIIGAILLTGIIMFAVMGVNGNTIFAQGYAVVLNTQTDPTSIFNDLGIKITHKVLFGDKWYIYCSTNPLGQLADLATMTGTKIGETIFGQTLIGNAPLGSLNSGIISITIASASLVVYSLIRNNWTSIVPMIVGLLVTPLLALGINSIIMIKLDQYLIFGLVFVSIINAMFCMVIINNINSAWSRNELYSNIEYKTVINVSLKNSWTYIWTMSIAYFSFVVVYGLSMPINMLPTISVLIIGYISTLVVSCFIVPYVLYWFLILRTKLVNRTIESSKRRLEKTYDAIDEQLVEGINHFTKINQPK